MMPRSLASRAAMGLLAALCALIVLAAEARAVAETHAALSFFYDELEPYGDWVGHPRYGTVWRPRHRTADWQPYVDGRWVWTADYGWYWDADEEWGWAAYHYGRWALTDAYGWVWVPDDEWGPAWVEWRTGDGYVGWAPMPPEVAWQGGTLVYGDVDLSAPHYHPCWVFIAEGSFLESDAARHRLQPARTAAMLRASVRATSYRVVGARIVNRSVDPVRISEAANVRIRPAAVALYDTHVRARAEAGAGDRVAVYRPAIGAYAGLRVRTAPVSAPAWGRGPVGGALPPPIDRHGRGSITGSRIDAGGGLRIGH
jgi:hypothetical protein